MPSKSMKILPAVFCAALLAGCAGTYFTFDKATQVRVGMKEAEVVRIMGRPYLVTTSQNATEWVYSYADLSGARAARFTFDLAGTVISVPRIPQSFLRNRTNQVVKPVGFGHSKI